MLLPTVVYVVLLAHFAGVNVLFPRPLGERVRERGKYIVSKGGRCPSF